MRPLVLLFLLAACSDSDDTLMNVCEVGGTFIYPRGNDVSSDACDDPQPILWPGMPLHVTTDVEGYDDSLDEAIEFWNDYLAFDAFVRDAAPADVFITTGSASDPGVGAAHHTRDDEGQLSAVVEYRKPGDITEAYYVFAHELGHVLGLAHDPDAFSSVMYPELDYGWDDEGLRNIRVTDKDQDALERIYP